MKITNNRLKQIIKEELSAVLNEQERGPMPEGTGSDFQDWVKDNIIWSREFQSYSTATSDYQSYFDHPNSILFDDEYTQEEKDQEERELSQKSRETDKVFEAFRDLMQKDMTPDQEERSDEIIEQYLEYI
jgi:aromatic ring-opening dioxygenase catalytic subunit (LigB family)